MFRSIISHGRQILRRLLRDAPPRYLTTALALFAVPLLLIPFSVNSDVEGSWHQLDSWSGGRQVRRVVTADGDPRYIYALSSSSGLQVSFDAGLHWQRAEIPVQQGPLGLARTVDLAVCPENPAEAYLLLESLSNAPRPMIYHSSDAGATWRAESGLGPTRVRGMTFGQTCDDLVLVTLADIYQAFVERDGQRIFVPNLDALDETRLAEIDAINSISDLVAVSWPNGSGNNVRHVYAATPDKGLRAYIEGAEANLIPQDTAHDTLSQFARNQAAVHAVCVDPSRSGLVCIGTDSGMFASMDAGVTWFPTAYALRHERVLSLLMAPSTDTIYAGLAGGGVYESVDNGATWKMVGQGLGHHSVYSLAMADRALAGKTLLAGTSDGIWQIDLSTKTEPSGTSQQ